MNSAPTCWAAPIRAEPCYVLVVIRPTELGPRLRNHSAPSGPAVIPAGPAMQPRLALGQRLEHGHLDQKPEPVAPMQPGHCGQLLETPCGLGRVDHELGQGGHFAGGQRPGGDRVAAQSLGGAAPLVQPDPLGIPALRLVPGFPRYVGLGGVVDVGHPGELIVGGRTVPEQQAVPGRRRLGLDPQAGQVPGGNGGQLEDQPGLGHPRPRAESAGKRRAGRAFPGQGVQVGPARVARPSSWLAATESRSSAGVNRSRSMEAS
jgi:hypothetical protein